MTNLEELTHLVAAAKSIQSEIARLIAEPESARKGLATAVIGHKSWQGYDIKPVANSNLHKAALEAVTDYLCADLADRNRVELRALADKLDAMRQDIARVAGEYRFEALDEITRARIF